jgi:hypothetical protein
MGVTAPMPGLEKTDHKDSEDRKATKKAKTQVLDGGPWQQNSSTEVQRLEKIESYIKILY